MKVLFTIFEGNVRFQLFHANLRANFHFTNILFSGKPRQRNSKDSSENEFKEQFSVTMKIIENFNNKVIQLKWRSPSASILANVFLVYFDKNIVRLCFISEIIQLYWSKTFLSSFKETKKSLIHEIWLKERLTYFGRKLSMFGYFLGPYFSTFGLKTEIYSVNYRIWSNCGKIRQRKNCEFRHKHC